MSEDFRAALDEGLGEKVYSTMLDNLSTYCRGHFGFEERCMTELRCPVARINKEAHKKMMQTLSGFQQHYATHGYNREEARRLVDTIDQWLDRHICQIDVHLRRCVSK